MTDTAGCAAPLQGVRVLDLTDGPMVRIGRLLADLGADIVAVDLAGVTGHATEGPVLNGVPLATAINRHGIETIEVDPGSERWRDLVADASILIENTPPGSAAEGILDAPRLRATHPQLVVLSISDFGRGNPFETWQGTSPVFHALTSELSRTGRPGEPPFVPPGDLPYDTAAAQALVMTLAVYLDALRTGRGDRIDFSVLEGAAAALDPAYGMAGSASRGQSMASLPRGRSDLSHQYPIFPCADGYIRICVLAKRQWQGMFEWMGRPERFADPKWENLRVRFTSPDLNPAIAEFFSDKTRAELEKGGHAHGVPTAALLTLDEALSSPHVIERGFWRDVELAPGVVAPVPAGVLEVDGVRATALDIAADAPVPPRPTGAPILAARPRTDAMRPLEGIRVVDFGVIIVGGDSGRILGDLGADVIKVENSAFVDGSRQSFDAPMAPGFASGHRNKRGVGVDLKHPDGIAFARRLIATADIVLSNWKPGTAASLGLSYDDLKAVNPGIVVVDSSAFGPTGPWSGRLGYGPLVRAATGFTLQWSDSGHPGRFYDDATVYPDHVSSRTSAFAALAMLLRRETTGAGGSVSIAQAEAISSHMAPAVAERSLRSGGASSVPRDAPWGRYPARGDDEWMAITVRSDDEFAALATTIGRGDLLADAALATAEGRDRARTRIDEAVTAWTMTQDPREAMALLQAAGVPAGWMIRAAEMPEWDLYRLRDGFRSEQHPWDTRPYTLEDVQYHSERTFSPLSGPAPLLGEHTVEVAREWLGMPESETRLLLAAGALDAPPLPDRDTLIGSEAAFAG